MYVRGATITFDVVFKDENGADTLATNPILRVAYRKDRQIVSEEMDMERVGTTNTYSVAWDSANAEPGEVFWHARGDADVGTIASENSFTLVANKANPSQ